MKPTVLTGILLAAGRGRRFDPVGQRNKLLQQLPGGEPVVVASARRLLACVSRVVAVVRPEDGGVHAALRALGCEVTVCPDADTGMGASLAHAIRQSLPTEGWLVALGDMPFVTESTLAALRDAVQAGAGIAVPVHGGRRGNPVAFDACHCDALLAMHGDQGARRLLQAYPVLEIAVSDPGILRDIDTPSDLPE
ncbi:NTP transferase domain-containing protein [Massilia sp. BSC265]|uniref:nucleotidyltransferase family protein n=1 Tax=Massilia sp. BSC265 TaxID=1549812 RepID=UPI0004E8F58A|nr:nucleotidyltransferase family protein [Massilia sp. BSC265]KFI09063.1 molybdopterin-guanine dinucleotide biosynthesis protein MobA [Massilia sp. BSC265]